MKKTLYLAVIGIVLFAACSKKLHPTAISPVAPAEIPAAHAANAMIIMDGYGNTLTPLNKIPAEANIKTDHSKTVRAFTPNEIANLTYRYQTVPPRILYVPDIYTLKSLRGQYCIYKKKFWYWKKEDGLFYLDETYYK